MATNSMQKSPLAFQLEDHDSTQKSDTIPPLKSPSCSSSQQRRQPQPQLLEPFNSAVHRCSSKRAKSSDAAGKENLALTSPFLSKAGIPNLEPLPTQFNSTNPLFADSTAKTGCSIASNILLDDCCLGSTEETSDCGCRVFSGCKHLPSTPISVGSASVKVLEEKGLDPNQRGCYSENSMESRLLMSIVNPGTHDSVSQSGMDDDGKSDELEPCTQLDVLLKLCSEVSEQDGKSDGTEFSHHQEGGFNTSPIHCPLCGTDITHLTDELRQVHTNDCLDKEETPNVEIQFPNGDVQPLCPGKVLHGSPIKSPRQIGGVSPVLKWLHTLGLGRYQEVFVQEEIDWDTLQWLTEEDLFSIGVTALGPRKRIVHALSELRKGSAKSPEIRIDSTRDIIDETSRLAANKLITDYFPGPASHRKKDCTSSSERPGAEKSHSDTRRKQIVVKKNVKSKTLRDIPLWCYVPGTPFRVDAFKYLRRDCSHWFLSHFHLDHYQGLTRSFSHGKIYCSVITARLVNMKIGIPWDKLQVLPLNQKTSISGIDVTCFDANHCPGSIILLFEPPNGKAVLHTGDFRFCEEMKKIPVLQCVQTLILDTTYCNPQYDFPKQEAVIQFVIEAIQAEAFNPKTLFLIGSYTIGKERLFLEVARVLRKKVYVAAAKLRLLECLGLSAEDMQWFTINEQESHIHVVPMWTLASFKRLKCIANQYAHRFSLIIAFSPTGWTFGKGKKFSGRRYQQGTIVRYEVPYSEHCSFTELKEFVKFISPATIIPSVNNNGLEAANAMISLLMS